jgi:hypothetical protein
LRGGSIWLQNAWADSRGLDWVQRAAPESMQGLALKAPLVLL